MTAALPSLTNLKPNPARDSLPLFDRTGWWRMAFGEFAESIGERAEPRDAREEIHVGLEHLDPQCLHIRRWGKGSDVTGTKLRFRKGRIHFINAVNEVPRERAQSFLTDDHIERRVKACERFKDKPGFTRVDTLEEIRAKDGNLSIPLYVVSETQVRRDEGDGTDATMLPTALATWLESSRNVRKSLNVLVTNAPLK